MDLSRLRRGEVVALVGATLMAICVFVGCYKVNAGNRNANIDGATGTLTLFDVHPILRWIILAAAIAPFVLAYVIARDHKLSWPRGELTAVIGIAAVGLLFYSGVVSRPGEPSGQIKLTFGWYGMMLGALLIVAGGAIRSGETERRRKPPGVL